MPSQEYPNGALTVGIERNAKDVEWCNQTDGRAAS